MALLEQDALRITEEKFGSQSEWGVVAKAYFDVLSRQETAKVQAEPTERVIARVVPFFTSDNEHVTRMN